MIQIPKLPAEPAKRRVIFVLSREQILELDDRHSKDTTKDEFKFLHKRNPQVQIVEFESAFESSDPIVESLLAQPNLFNVGSVLIQDPYNPQTGYKLLSESSYAYAVAKCTHIADFFCILGASNIEVEQLEMKSYVGKTLFKGKIEDAIGLGMGGGASAEASALDRMKNAIQVSFHNLKLRKISNPEHEELVRQRIRLMDEYMRLSVFEKNLIQSGEFALTTDFSTESRRVLDIALNLEVPSIIKLGAQFEKTKQETYSYVLSIKAIFSP